MLFMLFAFLSSLYKYGVTMGVLTIPFLPCMSFKFWSVWVANHYIAWNLIKYLVKTILGSTNKKISARLVDLGR